MLRGKRRQILGATLALLLAGLAWHWSAGHQVRLHQKNLQVAVENRNWPRVSEFVSPDYHDRWGQSRALVLERLPIAFSDFLACGILSEEISLDRRAGHRVLRAKLRIVGSGGPVAQFVMGQSAALTAPFDFTWQRASWWPWDWALVSVDQPQLEIPAESEP